MSHLSKLLLLILVVSSSHTGFGQEQADTTTIQPIQVNVYFSSQPLMGLTASAQSITRRQLDHQQTNSLLPALNTVAGIRMEERSPGSYRLAMRGSLIRSPFGIRNAKIYMDEFPLTDAGGNTYLNLIDPFSLHAVHILKGPDGSLYGANSGGVLRLDPKGFGNMENKQELVLSGGSYGLFQEQLSLQHRLSDAYQFSVDQSFMRADGYRENTALNKKTFQTAHQWTYSPGNMLKLYVLYADLGYRTPGGLTEAQMKEDPSMARPAAGQTPGAKEQKAGIYNKTWYMGLAHEASLSKYMSHHIAVFGSTTDLENPFITNYEIRAERNLGVRTYFSYTNNDNRLLTWTMQAGFEGQKGWNRIENYGNERGAPTALQDRDKLNNAQTSVFYRATATFFDRWLLEGSLSWNTAAIDYTKHFPQIDVPSGEIDFGSIWMPRIASSYSFTEHVAARGSISKGYSAPTLAEVRASDNRINTGLNPETGTNYEIGLRAETKDRRFLADVSAYSYQMKNGIVRQLRENGEEYYVNAGEMDQKGIEASVLAHLLLPSPQRFLQQWTYQGSLARNFYRFGDYVSGNDDHSGNAMTAVPDWTVSNSVSLIFPKKIYVNLLHNYVSGMPLNDANTFFAESFHLLQAKAGMDIPVKGRLSLQVFVGADNLLNQQYSLGNDINAFGNRFFNPAAPRNYYGGVKIAL